MGAKDIIVSSEEQSSAREERIRQEDERLYASPKQRKLALLDYIRRGTLHGGIEIQSDLIDISPEIIESDLIDFDAIDFNPEAIRIEILNQFKQFENKLVSNDEKIRNYLKELNLEPINNELIYLDDSWFNEFRAPFTKFDQPKGERDKRTDEEFVDGKKRALIQTLKRFVNGPIESLVEEYSKDQSIIDLKFDGAEDNSQISLLIQKNRPKNGFRNLPKLSEYKGETIEEPERFVDQEPKPNLTMIKRDTVPTFKGGVILDGNFGYDESGKPIMPDDKLIIDHHDKFDSKTHDTATIMAFRNIEDDKQYSLLNGPNFRDENGELHVITNNIDSDAITSTWVIYNRDKLRDMRLRDPKNYKKFKNIAEKIVDCGDFLLGSKVLDYGATARDYEYIISNYLKAAREQILDEKRQSLKTEASELERERGELTTQAAELLKEQLSSTSEESQELSRQLEETKRRTDLSPQEKGLLLKDLKAKLLKSYGDFPEREQTLKEKIWAIEKQIKGKEKEVREARTTLEDETKLLSHMHDKYEDIIQNPFKYKKFMLQGRKSELNAFQELDALYRNGNLEIQGDPEDEDILMITPINSTGLPEPENFDGQYFYLRSRVDFNRPLILKMERGLPLLAINTQRKSGLEKYDFNLLIDRMRERDSEIIERLINEKQSELEKISVSGSPEKQKMEQIRSEMKKLKQDQLNNEAGKTWRSRTQMIFAFKTYIPQEEMMTLIHTWKKEQKGDGTLTNDANE